MTPTMNRLSPTTDADELSAVFDDHRDRATFRDRLHHKNVHNGVTIALFMASRWFLVLVGLLFAFGKNRDDDFHVALDEARQILEFRR